VDLVRALPIEIGGLPDLAQGLRSEFSLAAVKMYS
jgi:hypothetical protein